MIKTPKYWIGVACKEHVANGVKLGICQFCHGKKSPAQRPKKNDFIIYYSPKISMQSATPYQKFTAIGTVTDDEPYQVDTGNGFRPYRRNIKYFDTPHVCIRPLINKLPFIQNKQHWGAAFRYGFIEIDGLSFEIISNSMLGYSKKVL